MSSTDALKPTDADLHVHTTFRSSETAVRTALSTILAELEPAGLAVSELGTIEIALAEALNNVVEHAYGNAPDGGLVDVSCRLAQDGLHFRVIDEGTEMPDGDLPLGQAKQISDEIDDLPEGGFGWFLIRSLAREVTYRRENERNVLDMHLAIGARS